MSSKGLYTSPASIKVKSCLKVAKVSPEKSIHKTLGIKMTKKEASQLAVKLLVLAGDDGVDDEIVVTSHMGIKNISVIGKKIVRNK